MNLFAFFRRPKPAPTPPRLSVAEAIIISKSGNTPESWAKKTDQERAKIRASIGIVR